MNKLHKILLFIVSLIGLALSFTFFSLVYSYHYSIPFILDVAGAIEYGLPSLWFDTVLAGYFIFICVCFLALLLISLFYPNKYNDLILVKDKGRLSFSRQTVESTVRYSFADVEGVSFSKVRVKIHKHPEKTRVYVKLSFKDPSRLAEMTETIQNKIESALNSSLGVPIKSINIKVVEFSPDGSTEKADIADAAKTGRVE